MSRRPKTSNDAATADAVIKRLREFRLPRAMKMQETVEAGGRLSDLVYAIIVSFQAPGKTF